MTEKQLINNEKCILCGCIHKGFLCGRVRAIKFFPSGDVELMEFHCGSMESDDDMDDCGHVHVEEEDDDEGEEWKK